MLSFRQRYNHQKNENTPLSQDTVGHLWFAVRFRVISPSIILLCINDRKIEIPETSAAEYHFGIHNDFVTAHAQFYRLKLLFYSHFSI